MREKKEEILGLFDLPELSRVSRNRNLTYIKNFYAILEDDALFKEQILDRCRGGDRLEQMIGPQVDGP